MDGIQEQHERAVGEAFVNWYNEINGTHFVFVGRPDRAPDFIYRDRDREMMIEVAQAYYDERDATIRWQQAREVPGEPRRWRGIEPDEHLISNINHELADKCQKAYGRNCILVVNV